MALLRRLISPIVELRDNETGTALLMFAYSFLAMTAVHGAQADHAIELHQRSLGADNLPYVLFVFGLLIGSSCRGTGRRRPPAPGGNGRCR